MPATATDFSTKGIAACINVLCTQYVIGTGIAGHLSVVCIYLTACRRARLGLHWWSAVRQLVYVWHC
jgi:hypothetical protein